MSLVASGRDTEGQGSSDAVLNVPEHFVLRPEALLLSFIGHSLFLLFGEVRDSVRSDLPATLLLPIPPKPQNGNRGKRVAGSIAGGREGKRCCEISQFA